MSKSVTLALATFAALLLSGAVCFAGALALAWDRSPRRAPETAELHPLSDQYSVACSKRGPCRIYVKITEGQLEHLGTTDDPGWAERSPFGLKGLRTVYFAVSEDGRSIVYSHVPEKASRKPGERARKPGGIYVHRVGDGERLVHEAELVGVQIATRWPRRLPADLLVFKSLLDDRMFGITAEGEESPLALLEAAPIHWAAYEGSPEDVAELMDSGATLEAQTYWGHTPLVVALVNGNQDVARELVKRGAETSSGSTPADYLAARHGDSSVLELMLQKEGDPKLLADRATALLPALFEAAKNPFSTIYGGSFGRLSQREAVEVLDLLVLHGADLNRRDASGRTLLHKASAKATRTPIPVRRLVELGVDPNVPDAAGNLAIHLFDCGDERPSASQPDRWEVHRLPDLKALAAGTEDIDSRNREGYTPLQMALTRNHIRTALFLVSQGADDTVMFIRKTPRGTLAGTPSARTARKRIKGVLSGSWWNAHRDRPHR